MADPVHTTFYAYTHARPDGSVFYVGKGQGRRAWRMKRENNPHHCNIVAKYGAENIIVATFPAESEEAAFALECRMIKDFRASGLVLANITDGGEGQTGRPVTERQLAALAKNWEVGRTLPLSQREKIGLGGRGRKLTEEHIAKLVARMKGKPMNDNCRAAAAKANSRQRTPEERAFMSFVHTGRVNAPQHNAKIAAANLGVKRSPDHCAAISSGKAAAFEARPLVQKECPQCGQAFETKFPKTAIFCCRVCSSAHHYITHRGAWVPLESQRCRISRNI